MVTNPKLPKIVSGKNDNNAAKQSEDEKAAEGDESAAMKEGWEEETPARHHQMLAHVADGRTVDFDEVVDQG